MLCAQCCCRVRSTDKHHAASFSGPSASDTSEPGFLLVASNPMIPLLWIVHLCAAWTALSSFLQQTTTISFPFHSVDDLPATFREPGFFLFASIRIFSLLWIVHLCAAWTALSSFLQQTTTISFPFHSVDDLPATFREPGFFLFASIRIFSLLWIVHLCAAWTALSSFLQQTTTISFPFHSVDDLPATFREPGFFLFASIRIFSLLWIRTPLCCMDNVVVVFLQQTNTISLPLHPFPLDDLPASYTS